MRRGEMVEHFETMRLRKDGNPIRLSLTLSPWRDQRGRLSGFVTIARDLTQHHVMRETLARREQELEDLFEEASVGLIMLTEDGKILRANRAFLELLNLPRAKLVGCHFPTFHPEPRVVKDLLQLLSRRRTIHNLQTELINHRRQPKSVLLDADVLWEKGRFVYSRWFVRDISRRRQLEQELLEISERERRGFAQELHDGLGQQLGGVAYLSNVLRLKLVEQHVPEAAEANRIFNLLREAIEQTRRIARGLSPIPAEPAGLNNALKELAQQTHDVFGIQCQFESRKPVLVLDPTLAGHLFRIAQEAINNATKHANAKKISIYLNSSRNTIQLKVNDNGRGIGLVSPRRKGLGLRIMQHRANLLRGSFVVRPYPGGGTTVTCSVPINSSRKT